MGRNGNRANEPSGTCLHLGFSGRGSGVGLGDVVSDGVLDAVLTAESCGAVEVQATAPIAKAIATLASVIIGLYP